MIFKFLPDVRIQWRDVWIGALMTGLFFGIGKWALGLYLSSGAAGSARFGATGDQDFESRRSVEHCAAALRAATIASVFLFCFFRDRLVDVQRVVVK